MLDNNKARTAIAKVVNPAGHFLMNLGLSANAITIIGTVGVSAAALWFFPTGEFFTGTLVILLFVFSDLLDGTVARLSGKPNPIGAFLDSTLDRVTDAALFGSIVLYYANEGSWLIYPALITAFAAQFISYIRAKAESLGIEMHVGVAERPERMILILVGTGFSGLGLTLAIDLAVLVLSVLTLVTVFQRMHLAFRSTIS